MNGNTARILIVDDERDTVDALADLILLWGYAVEPCYGGSAALAAVRRRRPDLILLDLAMLPMDGFTVVARLRECRQWDQILVVALSGLSSDAHRHRARLAGIDYFLQKPIEPNRIKFLLGEVLGDFRYSRADERHAEHVLMTASSTLSRIEAS